MGVGSDLGAAAAVVDGDCWKLRGALSRTVSAQVSGARVYAVALSGGISHVPFWRLRRDETEGEKRELCVWMCVGVSPLYT